MTTQSPINLLHLQSSPWNKANILLVEKAISEFSHELLITPEFQHSYNFWGYYILKSDAPQIEYRFYARKMGLDHWVIKPNSVERFYDHSPTPVKLQQFVLDFKQQLGINETMLPIYLEEIGSTVSSIAFKLTYEKFGAAALVHASFQNIEHAMLMGHPCFVANSGRLGFSHSDFNQYAPEASTPFQLVWIAVHKSKASFQGVRSLPYEDFITIELGSETVNQFKDHLIGIYLNPADYIFMPVHPWQWNNKIVSVFSDDIAAQYIVYLGKGEDDYLAQQSIRTLYNNSHPEKHYTKTALSILNMGFMRGMSAYYMQSTPAITDWITDTLDKDAYLTQVGFNMLDEVATIGFKNTNYEPLGRGIAHNKMLATLWRESPLRHLQWKQRVMTMAALLHKDGDGKAFLKELIAASSLNANDWVRNYLNRYLKPILHCFYKYQLVFMPHGENVLLVLENNVPVKLLMKDITEEVLVFNDAIQQDPEAFRLYKKTNDEMQLLSIFTDVFDCFFRFLTEILETQCELSEAMFWKLVADCIIDYQNNFPEFADRFKRYDLFQATFKRCCLNRLQLSNTQQMLDLNNPIESLKLEGSLKNPIAKFKPATVTLV